MCTGSPTHLRSLRFMAECRTVALKMGGTGVGKALGTVGRPAILACFANRRMERLAGPTARRCSALHGLNGTYHNLQIYRACIP